MLAKHPPQDSAYVRNYGIEIQQLQRKHLPPAESEELTRQSGSALAGLTDLTNFAVQWIVRFQRFQSELAGPIDTRQEIIEIVSDPAGEAADCLHFLRLP